MNVNNFSEKVEDFADKFKESPLAKKAESVLDKAEYVDYDVSLAKKEDFEKIHTTDVQNNDGTDKQQERDTDSRDIDNSDQGNEESDTLGKDEISQKQGGRYKDLRKISDGETQEVHHMPADSSSKLERNDGPAIIMEKEDHRQTASCGSSRESREYRTAQKELIEQGKFRKALQMDIDDLHDKFGDKYNDAIADMLEYVDKLEKEGRLDG